ncbi:MAG: DivIVA domain-containing protein [Coprobacillus sp.]|nr:DivIVA domain-containing protein [Coprobacillus sp.]
MKVDLSLDSNQILEKKFSKSSNGYDSLEVDEFLDQIIEDYQKIEEEVQASNTTEEALKEQIQTLEIELEKYKSRLKGISETDTVSLDNMDLIKRIRALEDYLFDLGYDPSSIK